MSSSHTFKCRQIDKYDGQCIFANGKIVYELGNYLGGGASGSVYQGTDPSWHGTEKAIAIKILNPLGYKNMFLGQINQCAIAAKGLPLTGDQIHGKLPMSPENVWWLLHPNTKQIFAAFEDPHRRQLRELPLTKCVEIWGMNPLGIEQLSEAEAEKLNFSGSTSLISGKEYRVPLVSAKYLKFIKNRQQVCREMSNMVQIGEHPNIIALMEVLELIQDSKTTLFLVLELINGGELFDRMKAGSGKTSTEDFARRYFIQLLSGIDYCHKRGVVHRDLKPENLLLSDPSESAILKIADFGLSNVIFAGESIMSSPGDNLATSAPMPVPQSSSRKVEDQMKMNNKEKKPVGVYATPLKPPVITNSSGNLSPDVGPPTSFRRLRSVVGSPHYIAPEIASDDPNGYDGRKVDMWSAGVILYSLFTGSLPFGGDLSICPRYKRYKHWITNDYALAMKECRDISLPAWFWPTGISAQAGHLLVGLLQSDPSLRLTAAEAMRQPWCLVGRSLDAPLSLDIPGGDYSLQGLESTRSLSISPTPSISRLVSPYSPQPSSPIPYFDSYQHPLQPTSIGHRQNIASPPRSPAPNDVEQWCFNQTAILEQQRQKEAEALSATTRQLSRLHLEVPSNHMPTSAPSSPTPGDQNQSGSQAH